MSRCRALDFGHDRALKQRMHQRDLSLTATVTHQVNPVRAAARQHLIIP